MFYEKTIFTIELLKPLKIMDNVMLIILTVSLVKAIK